MLLISFSKKSIHHLLSRKKAAFPEECSLINLIFNADQAFSHPFLRLFAEKDMKNIKLVCLSTSNLRIQKS
ncbi:hypothetical protein B0I21_106164 [Sphingobacterium paludis]|uniref:Uncharacterized protein n=1 Tax=Sphingobacterium paludis TaxID=1476465 RepID=A0A4R7D0M0_9SPHI|nr:hypothetical protein B0I21_106164 [Sphingobacterium paludis]